MEKTDFKKKVDSCINDFILDFMKNPNNYINESDMVPHFFKTLYDRIGKKQLYSDNEENIFLLHSEYLTYAKLKGSKGNSGYFDLVVLNNDVKKIYDFKGIQQISIAIEFKMNIKPPEGKLKQEIRKDLNKLKNPENKVNNQYFIFIIKNGEYGKERFNKKKGAFLGAEKTRDKKTKAIIDLMRNERYSSVNCYYVEYDIPWDGKTKELFTEYEKEPKSGYDKYKLKNNVFVFKKDKK